MPDRPKPHMPTLVTVLIIVLVLLALYHFIGRGRKK